MAGVGLKVHFRNVRQILDAIKSVKNVVQGDARMMDKLGVGAVRDIKNRFRMGDSPEGVPWQPLKFGRMRGKGAGQPLLDTGRLRNSIDYQVTKKGSVVVGTNVIYAATHHYGDPNRVPVHATRLAFKVRIGGTAVLLRPKKVSIPARPFMGLSAKGRASLNNIMDKFINSNWKAG